MVGSQSTDEAQDDDGEGEQSCTTNSSKWVKGIRKRWPVSVYFWKISSIDQHAMQMDGQTSGQEFILLWKHQRHLVESGLWGA